MRKSVHTKSLPRWAFAGLAGGLLAVALQVHAQPTGTQWDCIVSGKGQQGVAFITFAEDGTFSGYQLLSTVARKNADNDERSPFGDVGRYPEERGTNAVSKGTNVFGFSRISGPWGYDTRGRVIGHYVLYVRGESETDSGYTNSVSFAGTVVPGKKLTLVASTPSGKLTYACSPYRATANLGGAWYGTRLANKQTFLEFFTLTSLAEQNPFGDDYSDLSDYPGIYYSPSGEGAGYNTEVFALVSSRKKIGFGFESTRWGETNSVLSATFGTWSSTKTGFKANTSGVEHSGLPINFKASLPGF